jgi:hypothetical protein
LAPFRAKPTYGCWAKSFFWLKYAVPIIFAHGNKKYKDRQQGNKC